MLLFKDLSNNLEIIGGPDFEIFGGCRTLLHWDNGWCLEIMMCDTVLKLCHFYI